MFQFYNLVPSLTARENVALVTEISEHPMEPEEALALVDKHPGRIDLLLTDVVMPGLSGPQLADRLTARRPETRVVFMSGYPEAQDPALGFSLNGRSYLQKPFALAELAEKIRQSLDE